MPHWLYIVCSFAAWFLPGILSWPLAEQVTNRLKRDWRFVLAGILTIVASCGLLGFVAWYMLEPWSPNKSPLTEEFRLEVSLIVAAVQFLVGFCIALGWWVKYRELIQDPSNNPTAQP